MALVDFSHAAGREFAAGLNRAEQKSMGQFMTPPAIAKFMARRALATFEETEVRILEPSAGAGILAAATVDELLAKPVRPQRIDLMLCELDARLLPVLEELCLQIRRVCEALGVEFNQVIQIGDFLLSDIAVQGQPIEGLIVIANPPYFKIAKDDPRSAAHSYAVHGQPNIYGLFMAACARLVAQGGKWCFITPRSWMNGNYFASVRRNIFQRLRLDSFHAFENRKEHFEEDSILQEAVITWATGRGELDPLLEVIVTRSQGIGDLHNGRVQALGIRRVLSDDQNQSLSLPTHGIDPFAVWTNTLDGMGLKVSTGPVVPFRATEFVTALPDGDTVPLLWLQHITHNTIRWPINKKREHIKATGGSAWMLVPNQPMVVLRRFSPNEEVRRVIAAPYLGQLPGHVIGLENHLNYIYRPEGVMTHEEVRGLAYFLNSRVVDTHFRARVGSTQVNATELRKLTFPPRDQLARIGAAVPESATLANADLIIEQVLGIDEQAAATA